MQINKIRKYDQIFLVSIDNIAIEEMKMGFSMDSHESFDGQ